MGAGAIGSFVGGLLSKKNTVVLVGRPSHIQAIQHNGLRITGKTRLHTPIKAVETISQMPWKPDLLILTVKAFDTEAAIKQVCPFLSKHTIVLSLQNGLNNIDCISQYVDKTQILGGITTHGVIFSKPGIITHTGKGTTLLGELDGTITKRLNTIHHLFNEAGIETTIIKNIIEEIWIKAIINSSINPLTAFFHCKNGFLLKNPLLEKIVEHICNESTTIARSIGISASPKEMIKRTKQVIHDTSENYSSMLQSIMNRKPTEIDSINGVLVTLGKQHAVPVSLNEILCSLITSLEQKPFSP